jgi:alpha/beta hydrolase family protein
MTRTTVHAALLTLLAAAALTPSAEARITRIEITRIESPTFEGRSFGTVGPYEKLVGRAYGEIDPTDRRNAVIVDVGLAPRNARGLVEYDTDVYILRPVSRAKSNHRLWYEINNRGNLMAFPQFNDATTRGNDPTSAADAGNGYLMRQGYTILTSGWDISAAPGTGRFAIRVPVAVNRDGSPILGPAMEEFVVDDSKALTGPLSYRAATLDKSKASLAVRVRTDDPPTMIADDKWAYTDATGKAIKLLPEGTPFEAGTLYEFVYQARNPRVAGLGFAAIRDVGAFFRRAAADDRGTPNPIAGDIQYVYTTCVSQPCRTMHDFVWLGFNEDESGRKTVDGVINWIGGATGIFMNYRFAQPSRTHRQHIARRFPEFQIPFTNQVIKDTVTGRTDGRLIRCEASNTCPRIFELNSENEYWAKNMAMLHVDAAGNDLQDPPNVRSYLMASLPHQGGVGSTGPGLCQIERNPLVANPVLRALQVAMDEWVTGGKEPPASRLPRRADGTLVSAKRQRDVGFPSIPGVKYNGRMHTGDLFDYGPEFDQGLLTTLPPRLLGRPYPALVPRTDADGNDVAGIRLPDVAVPLATYTGWALRAVPAGGDDSCDAAGQKIPFLPTRSARAAAGDPRLSLEERYGNHEDYMNKVTAAAEALKRDRLLLDEDVAAYIRKAGDSAIGR